MNKLNLIETECTCEKCSAMCRAPCTGTPQEIERLMDLGYANRLMFDDDPLDVNPEPMIKPALKGYGGARAPYEVWSYEGCEFWKNGLCELHDKKLKPFSGRHAHHENTKEQWDAVCETVKESWKTEEAARIIEKFKKLVRIGPRSG